VKPKIAIPEPCSYDREYSQRALPAYVKAVESAGGEAVVIALDSTPEQIARHASDCAGVLLPGSKADVDPQKYGAEKHQKTAPADAPRDSADELLLQDAYNMHKPVLGICYGLQSLNVWRTGTLVQHIETAIDHSPADKGAMAHRVFVEPDSLLAREVGLKETLPVMAVNSSHHQAAEVVGDGLRAAARCEKDNTIEALEGTAADHYVLAVQWHPERNFADDPSSRALFDSFVRAVSGWKPAGIQDLK
jgi:putative glutamine amidotransferase